MQRGGPARDGNGVTHANIRGESLFEFANPRPQAEIGAAQHLEYRVTFEIREVGRRHRERIHTGVPARERGFAGTPTTVRPAPIDLVTHAPAPITASSPI